jgi:MFS family permease
VGVGGILGGFITASLWFIDRRGLLQLGSLLLVSLSLIGFALCTQLWSALVLLALAGFFEIIHITTNQTLLQVSIPDELRGRVTGVASLSMGLHPLGGFAAGVSSDLIGTQATTILFSSITGMIAIVVFLASPTVRGYRLSRTLKDNRGQMAGT